MGKDLARVSVVLAPGVSMNGVEEEVRKESDLKSRRVGALVLEHRDSQDLFEMDGHQLKVGSWIMEGSLEASYSADEFSLLASSLDSM
jgi:hypothetical protein